MKFTLIPVLSCLVAISGFAQDTENPGWTSIVPRSLEELVQSVGSMPVATASAPEEPTQPNSAKGMETPEMQSLVTPPVTAGGNAADEITPEILDLARGLRYDPTLIYAFVRNRIDFVPYFGCKKGAHLTLSEMSGNDIDQSALLVALLRASGYSPSYRSGPVAFSAEQHILWHGISTNPYGYLSDPEFADIIGTTPSDPQLYNERMYYGLVAYLGAFGYPIVQKVDAGGIRFFGIPHVWVQVAVGGTTYQLSPSFKQYNWHNGIDLVTATGFNKSELLTDANPDTASDADGTTWVADLKYPAISNRLSTYTTNFRNYIRANHDLIGPDEIFPGKKLIQKPILTLADADPFLMFSAPWAPSPAETWTKTAIPTERMSTLTVTAGTYDAGTSAFTTTLFNQPIVLPALKGRKLSLAFNGNTSTFRLDEATLGSAFTLSGATTSVRLALTHDNYNWTFSGGVWTKTSTAKNNRSYVQTYKKGNAYAYVFPYSFDDPQKLLRTRQEILARYQRNAVPGVDAWKVQTEVLNVMGLEWLSQSWRARRIFASLDTGVTFFVHRFGRVAQEDSFYIDAFGDRSGNQHRGQFDVYSNDIAYSSALVESAMEHGVLEQLQGNGAASISTVKAIFKANEDKTPLYRATSANWSSISSQFTGYSNLPAVATAVGAGAVALLPKSGDIVLGGWTGEGYATEAPGLVEMKISGLNGGYSVIPGPANTATVIFWGNSNPSYDSSAGNVVNTSYTSHTTPRQASADPVDLFSGAFFIDQTDLTMSGTGPLGLDFTRNYNSHLRHDDSSGLGYGWTDGNRAKIIERSSTRASLCETNTYQAAPFVVAALAQGAMHFQHTTAKEWATAALIAKWGIDQMKYNAAAVCIGNSTLEFIKMPDGSFVPPPGTKMALVKNPDSSYTLTKRHGDTFSFDATGKLASITNTSGKQKVFTYSGDNLSTVTDGFGRTLTYSWTGNSISSVGDGTRSVSFGFTSGNLTSFTDAENKTSTYHYDADRRMDWRKDPEGRMVIENFYDDQNRVKAQRSMGDPDREWTFTWSGFLNVEENPYEELNSYAYDARGRSIAVGNHLNEVSLIDYDGQDRIYYTATPENEEAYRIWDADNNLSGTIDPLGEIELFFYDNSLRLEASWDKRGNETSFTYTPADQIETITDPLLHTTTYDYYPTGLVKSITDAENKKTSYEYDGWGGMNKITDPDLKSRNFVNNNRGDVLTATDAENRTVTNTYNNRRQPLTSTQPTISGEPAAVAINTFDDSGNLHTVTDAKSNLTSFTYNALAQIVTTTLPNLPTGSNVITNTYDLTDWDRSSFNSLDHTVWTEWDAAHRVVATTDPLDRRTEFWYDMSGRNTETLDPLLRLTRQGWTSRGEKERVTDALDKDSTSLYDNNGNLTDFTNRRSKLYKSSYDDANRLEWSRTPGLKTTVTTYYDNNQVETIKEPSLQTTTFVYNGRNLVETKTDPVGSIGYSYDDSGLVEAVTEGGATINRTYDERGRLKTFTTADGDLIQYQYDANNNLARLTYPDAKEVNYTYNSRNLLETVTDWSNRVTTYTYDRLGRLTGTNRPNGTSNQIAHDAAGQVTSVKETGNGKLFSYLAFKHDDAGQITSRFQAPLTYSGWEHPALAATYDDDNRLATANGSTVVHDADGNMTSGPLAATGGNVALVYNARNQLTSSGTLSYTYDAEGRRRSITSTAGTTRDVIEPSGKLLVRHHSDTSKTYYVYGLGLLYEAAQSDATKTYHYDQVGSTLARTDDSGNVIGRATYSAYGLLVSKQGDMTTPFLYNGQAGVQTDSNGLLNMRARYYSPYLMRFLNADPIGFSGGSNWFAYADGNPISLNDPFGLRAEGGGGIWNTLQLAGQAQWNNLNAGAGFLMDGVANALISVPQGMAWTTDQAHHVLNGSWSSLGSSSYNGEVNNALGGMKNPYGNQGYYDPSGMAPVVRDSAIAAAMIAYGIAPGASAANVEASLAQRILASDRSGSGLKADASHRAASFLTETQLNAGTSFTIRGGDDVVRELLQTPGGMNGRSGIFEYILDPTKGVTHQRFIPGGSITGTPNQVVPR